MKKRTITYAQVGDDYDTKDPIKKIAQKAASETAKNLLAHGYREEPGSRGESAFVWSLGKARDNKAPLMASVVEGLGTKNLVADALDTDSGKTYYDVIGHDTVATIINDLISVGATPLVVHAYWAIENNEWLQNKRRMTDLVSGWKTACDMAGATWGGGETPTLKGIVVPNTIDLGGAATGIIKDKRRLITDKKLKAGDRILLLKSNGINANGLSLARAVAKKLPKGYKTIVANNLTFGEAILTKTNIYAKLLEKLFQARIDIHYISNITGHGLRKLMRGRTEFTYVVEKIAEPQPLFPFIQKHANLSDFEMYQTYNMGMDYALFIPEKQIKQTQIIIKKCGFSSLDAGYVDKGKRQVIVTPLNLRYNADSLNLR